MLEIVYNIASKFKSATLTCYIPLNPFERIMVYDLLVQFHNSSQDIIVENTSDFCASLVLKNCSALPEMNAAVIRLINHLVKVSETLCFSCGYERLCYGEWEENGILGLVLCISVEVQ